MKFLFNLSGANTPLIKEFDIEKTTAVEAGEVVGIKDNTVTKAADCEKVLGVCAETHTGTHDELNDRADGTKVRVIIAPDTVYSSKAPLFVAKSGTDSTLAVSSAGLSAALKSGFAVLVSKAENSSNTDIPGTKRRITGCAVSGETATLTLEAGGVPVKGDVYMLIPCVGDTMYLTSDAKGVCFYNAYSQDSLTCVCTDVDTGNIGFKINTSIFA